MRERLGAAFGIAVLLVAGAAFVATIATGFLLYLGRQPPDTRPGTSPNPFAPALWPAPQDARAATAPRDVARSFAQDFAGIENPALGPYTSGEGVAVFRRGPDGRRTNTVIASIRLDRLDGRRWFVTRVNTGIGISAPESFATAISSPLRIAGIGAGREDRVVVRLHAGFNPQPLARRSVTAGATRPWPFSTTLTFEPPRRGPGTIVVRAGRGRGLSAFAAYPVRFGGG